MNTDQEAATSYPCSSVFIRGWNLFRNPCSSVLICGYIRLGERAEYGLIGGFWLDLPVPQQRVVRAAADGPVVEPGAAVVDAPERDARDAVAVLHEDGEQLAVTLALRFENISRQALLVRVETFLFGGADLGATALARQDVDVHLGDHHLHALLGKG